MKDQKAVRIAASGLLALLCCAGLSKCGKDEKPPVKPPVTITGIGKAKAYVTTGDQSKLFSKENDLTISVFKETTFPVIAVDTTIAYQEIEGFGAAMTGSSAYVLNKMSSTARTALMQELFDPAAGIGVSYLRTTIGASDFSLEDFSYDDMSSGQTDYEMVNFSLEKDKTDMIPMLKAATAVFPDIKILGSPWSAPAWMKTNGDMEGGSLKTDAYDAYAKYFVKYVKGMEAEGITIDALTLQNEPLYSTASYPCMSMTSAEQGNFIKNNVGPMFAAEGISAKIIVYDHNWDVPGYATSLVNDAAVKPFIVGSAFHAYGGTVSAMTAVHNQAPDKALYFTEISGGGWDTNFQNTLRYFVSEIFIGTTKNWSKNTLLWNLALDENDGPKNNGCPNCRGLVTINSSSGNVTRNVEYYSTAHFSKFVRPGAVRIGSALTGSLPNVEFVAFMNTDGSKVLVAYNNSSDNKTFVVQQPARQFSYTMPPNAAFTVVWK